MSNISRLMLFKNYKTVCRQVFRYRENNYLTGDKIVFSHSWQHMKRLSCHGECCEGTSNRCYSPLIDAQEGCLEDTIINCNSNPEDGDLFEAVFVVTGSDFETGHPDEWMWEMIPFKIEDPIEEHKNTPTI